MQFSKDLYNALYDMVHTIQIACLDHYIYILCMCWSDFVMHAYEYKYINNGFGVSFVEIEKDQNVHILLIYVHYIPGELNTRDILCISKILYNILNRVVPRQQNKKKINGFGIFW